MTHNGGLFARLPMPTGLSVLALDYRLAPKPAFARRLANIMEHCCLAPHLRKLTAKLLHIKVSQGLLVLAGLPVAATSGIGRSLLPSRYTVGCTRPDDHSMNML